ncbi:MAG TPA: ShlB/FhaC/HecB family hemolysin secretion/activation protein [Desulfuromonadales bacterium]|nr:ShlB/FhaC/HecB family hemolysin secretion/activation protein [Desulfuromonadales bacterium]
MNWTFFVLALLIFLIPVTVAHAVPTSPSSTVTPPGAENEQRLNMLSVSPKVMLKQILFSGNTAVSTAELTVTASSYLNRVLVTEELEALRQALIKLYVSKGYINSGVIIPDQKVENGVITFTIIEGGLNSVTIDGLKYYRYPFLSSKLNVAAVQPLNVNRIQEALQLFQQDPRIKQINAELVPGAKTGEAELKVKINEASPLKISSRFNNDAAPATGSFRGELVIAHQNVLGFGDTLSAHSTVTEGAVDYGGRYSFPVSLYDTTLDVYYSTSNNMVIEEQFNGLDVTSENETIGLKIRQPFQRSATGEFAISLTGEKRSSVSKLLGQRFSFSAWEHDGKSNVSVLRLTQEWTRRTSSSVAGIYSTFNYGIAVLGATTNSNLPDGRFGSWIGQGMLLSRIGTSPIQTMLRANAQISLNQLLPMEKFPMGGLGSVRGYRTNTIVRDNGFNCTGEVRIPLFSNDTWPGTLQLVPFIDFGWGWNTGGAVSTPETITGIGGGLRWQVVNFVTAEAYYGYGIDKVPVGKKDLQDQGLHFQVSIEWL